MQTENNLTPSFIQVVNAQIIYIEIMWLEGKSLKRSSGVRITVMTTSFQLASFANARHKTFQDITNMEVVSCVCIC